jgi:DNA-binding MarR family transcriptional regulator
VPIGQGAIHDHAASSSRFVIKAVSISLFGLFDAAHIQLSCQDKMTDAAKPAALSRADLVEALNRAMRDMSGQAVLHSQATAWRLGVSGSDLECLNIVLLHGPLAAGALAARSGLTSGAITGVVDRLERVGLAKRLPDPKDRRRVLVRVPPQALRRLQPLGEPMARAMVSVLGPYDDEELALILHFLTRAHQAAAGAVAQVRAGATGARRFERD